MRTLAVSLYKIANDIRLMSCGPRAGFAELSIPANEPGSSIMPGKVNPTQAEALTMIAVQVMANDVAVGFGGAGGYLEMNVYKPLMIFNIMHSITILTDGCANFRKFLIEGTNRICKKIDEYVERSLMLVTALVAGHRLRQGLEDRALRDGQRPHPKRGGVEAWLCKRSAVRSHHRPEKDGCAIRCRELIGTGGAQLKSYKGLKVTRLARPPHAPARAPWSR